MDMGLEVEDCVYYPYEGKALALGFPGAFLPPAHPALSYMPPPPLQTPGIRLFTLTGLWVSPIAGISSKEDATCHWGHSGLFTHWEGAGLL